VLEGASSYWPLSVRAIYYRLLGTGRYPKGKGLAARVSEHVSNARRAGLIPWEAVFDSSEERARAGGWDSAQSWLDAVRRQAGELRLNRQAGQPQHILVWCEARGMVPMLSGVANKYGVDVLSSSGYDSTSVRHHIGTWAGDLDVSLVVLHVGDLDEDGEAIFRAAAEDVSAWAGAYGGRVEFSRLAVTRQQVIEMGLPGDPDRVDNVQAEAIPPETMATTLTDAIHARLDLTVYTDLLAEEQLERRRAVAAIRSTGPGPRA
jgi:hypothetical protein